MNVPGQVQAALRSAAREKKPRAVVQLLRQQLALSLADVFAILGADTLEQITLRDLLVGPREPAPRPAPKPAKRVHVRPANRDDWASEDLIDTVLSVLRSARAPMTTRELGAAVGVHNASIYRVIRRLGDRLIVTGNRRRYHVALHHHDRHEFEPPPPRRTRRVFLQTN